MVDKPSDNRRRISDNLLDEIEEFDGKDFSEQLLKWKNDSDNLSKKDLKMTDEQLEKQVDEAIERFKSKIDKLAEEDNTANKDGFDYTYIESIVEKHTDRVIKKLGR